MSYSLIENPLTPFNAYVAQPANIRSYSLEEIIQRVLARNPGLSHAQITASINEVINEICIIIEDGGSINTVLVNTQPSIAGKFNGAADTFDPKASPNQDKHHSGHSY